MSKVKRNKRLHRNIYKQGKRYTVGKTFNGKYKVYKSFTNISDAIKYRDQLEANNWVPLPLDPEEQLEKDIQHYYRRIYRKKRGVKYEVNNDSGGYMGYCDTIEEALYFRDQYNHLQPKEVPRPATLDLKTDNPYLINGLKYPVPEKLKPNKRKIGYGRIHKKGENSYHVHYGGSNNGHKSYICACRTYEQAWYVRSEMNKCNWDKKQLQRILDDYPLWYTKLMEFYRYINIDTYYKKAHGEIRYMINIPRKYLPEGKQLEHFTGYANVEDALWERDFLMDHEWDYDLLVEAIDDTINPYYNMDLPPYPQRKILNLRERNYHEKELTRVYELLQENPEYSQAEICEKLGIVAVTLRNWLKKYWNTTYNDFLSLCYDGINPITVLEKQRHIYQPDLSRPLPPNFNGYITYDKRSKKSPYFIRKGNTIYGYYQTREIANKVVEKLIACNWDKSQLQNIRESIGCTNTKKNRGNIYPHKTGGYNIHKSFKQKRVNYGHYKDYRVAEAVRDQLILHDWNKEIYPELRRLAETNIPVLRLLENNMFGGVYDYTYLEQLSLLDTLVIDDDKHIYYNKRKKHYTVQKSINGTNKSFGFYKTQEDAILARNILINNDWNRESLNLVEELDGK